MCSTNIVLILFVCFLFHMIFVFSLLKYCNLIGAKGYVVVVQSFFDTIPSHFFVKSEVLGKKMSPQPRTVRLLQG